MTLNRRPTADEKVKLKSIQQKGAILKAEAVKESPAKTGTTGKQPNKPAPKPVPTTPGIVMPSYPNDVTFYQDVFWALLNTNEFMLNH